MQTGPFGHLGIADRLAGNLGRPGEAYSWLDPGCNRVLAEVIEIGQVPPGISTMEWKE
jgi:hypothetical protein